MNQKDQVIAAMTQAMEENCEQQLHAIGLLQEHIDPSSPALDRVARCITLQTPAKAKLARWFIIAINVLALISLVSALFQLSTLIPAGRTMYSIATFSLGVAPKNILKASTAEGTLLLYGDPTRFGKANQMRALWESDPTNPAYFADYSLYYLQENGKLPTDFLATAEKIDPDNAWFTCLAAAVTAKDCIKKGAEHPLSPVTKETIKGLNYDERRIMTNQIIYQQSIVDEKNALAAYEIWKKSTAQPRYTSYKKEMYEKRYPHLPKQHDFLSQMAPIMVSADAPSDLKQLKLGSLLAAMLQKADMQSTEGKQLFTDVENYLQKLTNHEPITLIDALIMRATVNLLYQQINVVDTTALDQDLVKNWQKRSKAQAAHSTVIAKQKSYEKNDMIMQRAAVFTQLFTPSIGKQCATPPPITVDQLTPMRYVDHYFVLRLASFFTIILLSMFIGFLFFWRTFAAKTISHVGKEIAHLIPLRCYLFIIGCGILLPLSYYFMLYFFTPIGGRQWSMTILYPGVFPTFAYISTLVVIFSITILLSRKVMAPFRDLLSPCTSKKPWPLIWILLALIPLHCLALVLLSFPSWGVMALLFLPAPLLLWLLWIPLKNSRQRDPMVSVLRQVQGRLLITSSAALIIILTFASLCFHQGERYWIKQDQVTNVTADYAWTSYEGKVTKQLYRELIEIRDAK